METVQRLAILADKKKIVKKICKDICAKSGIYLFYRVDEDGNNCFYVGQAKNLLNRTAQHLMDKKQHIDKSLYKHKLYNDYNPYGWKLKVLHFCGLESLDIMEQNYIHYFLSKGYKSYNVTGGGQIDKKSDIGQRQQTKLKSYKNGKNLGYDKAKDYVKVMFDKYLDYYIKGNPTKIKERKLSEFEEWLEVQSGEDKED